MDYNSVKFDLGVPAVSDFAIVPDTLSEVRMLPQNGVPDSVQVVAMDYIVEVLYENGTVINERFGLRVW